VWKARNGANGKEEAYQVEVQDTTGAGDVFHAGFMHGLLSGWDIDQCCRFGCAAAALKCKKLGGQPGVISADKVSKWMKTASRYPKKI
jgi:sugar/nucleoside kinase (ribokinase family)